MSGQDYVNYLATKIITQLNLPQHVKEERKLSQQQIRKSNKWFGMLPFILMFFFKRTK